MRSYESFTATSRLYCKTSCLEEPDYSYGTTTPSKRAGILDCLSKLVCYVMLAWHLGREFECGHAARCCTQRRCEGLD